MNQNKTIDAVDPIGLSLPEEREVWRNPIGGSVTRVISLGAGVQSSAMLLMAIEGRFGDKPDLAIFADTQWEPRAVYKWLAELQAIVSPFPIVTVSKGNIKEDAMRGVNSGKVARFASLPFHLDDPSKGKPGKGKRQCSSEYKVAPIQKWVRENIGTSRKNPTEMWIGISRDEASRMKPSRVQYIRHRWPLIDNELRWEDCAAYLRERLGFLPEKSACIGCPFHDDLYWARQKNLHPGEHAEACEFDEAIRFTGRMRAAQFVHRSRVPLGAIREFKGEKQTTIGGGFAWECEGVCGV